MNERRLRSVYLVGVGVSAYAFWYFLSAGSDLVAVAFGVATIVLIARLRAVTADS
ncbi:hypothetical protein [Natrinema salaciae]|uniref:Uncharacterized protein n=1 Tax=Natrinema salaciae TaxID=1186196 RepID=A0A1H9KA36_9EURY|nr:hypothetical protein [Natrinema salaciae]SEQ96004.1 hypothetical protein SAMN04489841_2854 [Natrinema salaciae]